MPRPTNTEARRRQIADALRKVMARKGYDGASIGDVARAARLAPGLVHYHFESKLEILLAVLDGLVASHAAALERALGAPGDPAHSIEELVRFHLALDRADPETLACWVTLSGEALREPRVRRPFEAAIARITGVIEAAIRRGVKDGSFRCPRPAAAASALMAAIQGYFVLAASAPSVIPRGSAARAALEMASGLLAPSRPLRLRGAP